MLVAQVVVILEGKTRIAVIVGGARPGRCAARSARIRFEPPPAGRWRPGASLALALLSALWLAAVAAGPSSNRRGSDADVFWTRADLAQHLPSSIALLPAASFDSNSERERVAGVAWASNFGRTSYRWVSAPVSRALLSGAAGDSLLRLARGSVLKDGRVDSLIAPALCARLRVQAVVSVRIDSWDIQAIEPDQTGKPWSRAYVRAAAVDSMGRLLWSAAGGETVEGLYHEAQSHASGVKATALRNEFSSGAGAAPIALDVFNRVMQRWALAFLARADSVRR